MTSLSVNKYDVLAPLVNCLCSCLTNYNKPCRARENAQKYNLQDFEYLEVKPACFAYITYIAHNVRK